MKNTLRIYPDKCLSTPCTPWEGTEEELQELLKDMKNWLEMTEGVGLAAPQIGVNKNVFIANLTAGQRVFVNPQIVDCGPEELREREGCLSLPGSDSYVTRWNRVFVDMGGVGEEFSGRDARIIQHEMDHLCGELLLAHCSSLVKETLKKRVKKFRRFINNRYIDQLKASALAKALAGAADKTEG
jgi:peptide deformylase